MDASNEIVNNVVNSFINNIEIYDDNLELQSQVFKKIDEYIIKKLNKELFDDINNYIIGLIDTFKSDVLISSMITNEYKECTRQLTFDNTVFRVIEPPDNSYFYEFVIHLNGIEIIYIIYGKYGDGIEGSLKECEIIPYWNEISPDWKYNDIKINIIKNIFNEHDIYLNCFRWAERYSYTVPFSLK